MLRSFPNDVAIVQKPVNRGDGERYLGIARCRKICVRIVHAFRHLAVRSEGGISVNRHRVRIFLIEVSENAKCLFAEFLNVFRGSHESSSVGCVAATNVGDALARLQGLAGAHARQWGAR